MNSLRSSRFWVPALVALVCGGAAVWSMGNPVPAETSIADASPVPLTDEARALLGGLAVGDTLVGWNVVALEGPKDGEVRVHIGRDDVRFALIVTVRGERAESPPAMTKHYSVYYGHVQPPGTSLPQGTVRATTHALANRIAGHEANVDVPGM